MLGATLAIAPNSQVQHSDQTVRLAKERKAAWSRGREVTLTEGFPVPSLSRYSHLQELPFTTALLVRIALLFS